MLSLPMSYKHMPGAETDVEITRVSSSTGQSQWVSTLADSDVETKNTTLVLKCRPDTLMAVAMVNGLSLDFTITKCCDENENYVYPPSLPPAHPSPVEEAVVVLSEEEPTWFRAMLRSVVPRSYVCIMLIHDEEVRVVLDVVIDRLTDRWAQFEVYGTLCGGAMPKPFTVDIDRWTAPA